MHDKIAAADKLARFLGMYDDRLTLEHSGPAPVVQVVFTDKPDEISDAANDPLSLPWAAAALSDPT